MLHSNCPRTAAVLARCATRTRRALTWGSLAFRTASRRQAGLVTAASCYALAAFSGRFGYWAPYPGCAAAGSFSPVQAAAPRCLYCGTISTTAGACACFRRYPACRRGLARRRRTLWVSTTYRAQGRRLRGLCAILARRPAPACVWCGGSVSQQGLCITRCTARTPFAHA